MKRILILGGGISGLALGWFLRERFGDQISLTILEKSFRAGGWIRTQQREGFLFEEGPRSCRSRGAGVDTLELVEALGLQSEVLVASKNAQHRFIYAEGRFYRIPTNVFSFLFSPLMRPFFRALAKEWRISCCEFSDESIYNFISRRLNSEIAESLMDPLVSGIYAGDIRQLSMRACFPSVYNLEKYYGSLVKGLMKRKFQKSDARTLSPFVKETQKAPMFTFRQGMETLVNALACSLSNHLHLGCGAQKLCVSSEEVEVITENDKRFYADQVFLALPTQASAALLQTLDKKVAQQMVDIQAASVAVVGMGWREDVLKRRGFGYLIPSREKEDILGVVWDSSVFPQQNRSDHETRLTVMLGGAHCPEITGFGEAEVLKLATDALCKHLNIEKRPDAIHFKIAREAIPQYTVGHQEKVQAIESALSRCSLNKLRLVGCAWHGVSVNDCIAQAKQAAEKASTVK